MFGRFYILVVAAISSVILRNQGFHSISFCLMLALIYLLYKQKQNYPLLIYSVITFLFFYLNPFYFTAPSTIPTDKTITGQIVSIPEFNGNKLSFELKTPQKEIVQINYYAKYPKEQNNLTMLKYGYRCTLAGVYQDLPEKRNFYEFDYKGYLASKKIYFQFIPKSFSNSNCRDVRLSPFSLVQRYRNFGIDYLKENFP